MRSRPRFSGRVFAGEASLTLYLVRHGQAGTRRAYDSLSDLGRRQSRLLGEHFASQGIVFAAAYAGELSRQQQTAEEVRAAYDEADAAFPELVIDPGWNEFDLDRMYREIAPQMGAVDPDFLCEYEAMREQVRASGDSHASAVHRRWLPCDTKVVQAWIRGSYSYAGETWSQFQQRVAACREKIARAPSNANILVCTSATPTSIWVGLALDVVDGRVLSLAGSLYNASYTMLKLRHQQARLFMFNAVPHLPQADLRTHR
jgi:broad specificity phosphatase PhoE